MIISQIYNKNVAFIPNNTTIKEVVAMMSNSDHNGFFVVDKDKKVKGIITIQDIARAILPDQFENDSSIAKAMYKRGFFTQLCMKIGKMKVEKYMKTDFSTVSLEDNILTVISHFLENDSYIVPVVKNGVLVGIVSRKEIKKALSKGLGSK